MGPRVNDKIFAKTVQVISQDGQNLGTMDTSDALNMAMDAGLDLVEINAAATPVLVKIIATTSIVAINLFKLNLNILILPPKSFIYIIL